MIKELSESLALWRVWFFATIYRIVLSQRRTYLGTAWFFVGITMVVSVKALLFSGILSAPVERIVPNLAIGMAFWRLLAGMVNDSCRSIARNKAHFEQSYFPLFTPVLSTLVHQGFLLAHTIIPMFVISVLYISPLAISFVLVPAALGVIALGAVPVGFLLAVFCTRYRDLGNLVNSIMGVMFFLTPIIWIPEMAKGPYAWFLYLNPFFHFIELARDPLVGQPIEALNWIVAIGITAVAWLAAFALFRSYGRRVLIWL